MESESQSFLTVLFSDKQLVSLIRLDYHSVDKIDVQQKIHEYLFENNICVENWLVSAILVELKERF